MLGKVDELSGVGGIIMSEPFFEGETIKIIDGLSMVRITSVYTVIYTAMGHIKLRESFSKVKLNCLTFLLFLFKLV